MESFFQGGVEVLVLLVEGLIGPDGVGVWGDAIGDADCRGAGGVGIGPDA